MFLPVSNISFSTVNGPGNRLVIWVQGCRLNCKGCFNPETHSYDGGRNVDIDQIVSELNSNCLIDGITISGGEPLDYTIELKALLKLLRPSLTSIIYTGYTINEIREDSNKLSLIHSADLVLSGRYRRKLHHPYLGKKILNISGRIDPNYFLPKTRIEYSIAQDKVTKTGIFKTQL